jgi:ribose 5-phosphate isomerase
MIVVADETKQVDRLGGNTPLPVEIVSFGWQTVLDRLAAIGCALVIARITLTVGFPRNRRTPCKRWC